MLTGPGRWRPHPVVTDAMIERALAEVRTARDLRVLGHMLEVAAEQRGEAYGRLADARGRAREVGQCVKPPTRVVVRETIAEIRELLRLQDELPFGLDAGALTEPFCACGRVVSRCDRSRVGCRTRGGGA